VRKSKYLIDIPVALVFFNRPNTLKKVFDSVKKIKPSKLFLIQDGARNGNIEDIENIKKCRNILLEIDWECEVKKNYSDVNLGCGQRIYTGISWCFEYVDSLIILEDDCVPSDSFYLFCKEVLETYTKDPRIGMISGMNHLGKFSKITDDYLFAHVGSIAGWATWKRSWETIDFNLTMLNDENVKRLIRNLSKQPHVNKNLLKIGLEKKSILENGGNLTSWSFQRGLNDYLHSALVVVPRVNLMSNIGVTDNSVHTVNSIKKVPRGARFIYQLPLLEMEFPLNHPKYIIEDYEYNDLVNKVMRPNRLITFYRSCESIFYRIIYGDIKSLWKGFKKRFFK